MTRLEKAAIVLHRILWNNVGSNDDWPIVIQCDGDLLDRFTDALNELASAVEELQPGSKPWPIPPTPEVSAE